MILTAEKAIELLEEVVKENGRDYTYEPLEEGIDIEAAVLHYSYAQADPNLPGCIVGHVVKKFDNELFKELVNWERDPDPSIYRDGTNVGDASKVDFFKVAVSEEAVDVLNAAQMAQDRGHTWGDALGDAKNRAAERGVTV